MPVYNGARYIAQAIDSVLGQDYDDFELLVVNDGSADSTMEVLEQYSNKLAVINLPHAGISTARNKAIRSSTGEYVALIDSDDLWESGKLQLQVDYMDRHPDVGLSCTYYCNFTEDKKAAVSLVKKIDMNGNVFRSLFIRGGGMATSSLLFRRVAFEAVGGFDESLVAAEDFDLNLRISRAYTVGTIPKVLVRKRIHPHSFFSSKQLRLKSRSFPIELHTCSY